MPTQAPVRDSLSALASPTRREMLRMMWSSERSSGELASAFQISWPAVSQNLKVLRESGLVRERRLGTSRLYRADRAALRPLEAYLRSMWRRDLDRLRLLAEAEERSRSKS
jgi:DNA-binding transcriptional ArsR family regulator